MVKKCLINNNPANKNALKITPALLIPLFLILIFLSTFLIAGCMGFESFVTADDSSFLEENNVINQELEYISGEEVLLPEPDLEGLVSLEEALFGRRSIRDFEDRDIEIQKISQLLWAAQGITKKSRGFRTAPSAGALYPLDVFIFKKDGLFHYIPAENVLMMMNREDLRERLYEACLYQGAVAECDINIVITAVYERTTAKYGERGIRYVHLEAGHACQNILLEAVALELGAVPIGAFEDSKIIELMKLPDGYVPLYVIPVGYPE